MTIDIDGKPTRVYMDGTPFTIHDLVLMLERSAAEKGVHTTPALEYARQLRDEAAS
jgi:hypothetical protein